MKRRCDGLHAEIVARDAQHRHDSESLQQIAHLRKVVSAMRLALTEK
jgi:hypothetical protein